MIVDGEEVPSRTPYITAEVTNYAIEFIEEIQNQPEEQRRPFIVYLSHRPGHPPFQAPEDIKGIYNNQDVKQVLPPHVDPWWYGKANDNVFQGIMLGSYYDQYRRYCETLTAMDQDIERILDKLDELGLGKNTMVIYMGDNGMQWGTHDCHGIREAYEESIQLPFIVRAPWIIPDSGVVRSQLALNIDLAPTFLELAGEPIPSEMDGESLLPYLSNPLAEGRNDFLLEYWRYYPENTPSYIGIRTERYKYVEFERGRKPWLFDLLEDPGENVNLYGTKINDTLVPKLKARIQELRG
jgi:N-acetylglucosamine-6-sulfatase